LIQKRVLSNASKYYVVEEILSTYVPNIKDKVKPKRALIVIVAFVTAFILAIFGVFFIEFIKNSKNEADKSNI
jgi:uncharacterized protein involved in exopolysaccharide biosynthesis